jgi:alpha-glucosidase
MLELYRAALRVRRSRAELGADQLTWFPAGDGVLAFTRPGGFACVVNISGAPVALPDHGEVLLASGELAGGLLPPDTAAWLRTAG